VAGVCYWSGFLMGSGSGQDILFNVSLLNVPVDLAGISDK
jgi:hypothetical protein